MEDRYRIHREQTYGHGGGGGVEEREGETYGE